MEMQRMGNADGLFLSLTVCKMMVAPGLYFQYLTRSHTNALGNDI